MPQDKQHLFDCLFVEIHQPNNKNILIVIVYRSPKHNSENEFITYLNELLSSTSDENNELILLGDANIDLLKYNIHKQTSDYLDMCLCNGYKPAITLPTRVTYSSATLIDHIFVRNTLCGYTAGTITTDITDHFVNFVFIPCVKKCSANKKPHYVTYRPYSSENVDG